MTGALRKGWCPGALRPMAAKDGLLVRLRITGGILQAATAAILADLAGRHGNGLFDLSARGNLQMRGITEATLPALHAGLRQLGLLDRDAASESVRNVIASPLAGLHGGLDIRPLVTALEARLTADATLQALPGKFAFLIDDGNGPSLTGIEADVRLDWSEADRRFAVGLGGTRATALACGMCLPEVAVDRATSIARDALPLFARTPDARRLCDLVAELGADELHAALGAARGTSPAMREADVASQDVVGRRCFAGINVFGLAAPFGRLDAAMLRRAASLAASSPRGELRLTPWRTILVPHASRDTSSLDGFITDPADPRLAVAACVGQDGCERGTTSTHADATRLAGRVAGKAGIALHVSGCAKGCAKPSTTAITLVARDGRYDLVREGRAGDEPRRRNLDLAAAAAALETEHEPA